MKKFTIPAILLACFSTTVFSQTINGRLTFQQAQSFNINLKINSSSSSQMMGQTIEFKVDADAAHAYKVTNTTEDNTTLNHSIQHISFAFDGMGQKMKFNSGEEKDLKGPFGKPVKEMLEKKYDIIIDPAGKVMMAVPEKIELSQGDSRMAIITNMLKEVMDLVQPPQKDKSSFFQVLPEKELKKGDTWTTTTQTATSKADAAYVISEIGDSTILIDFVENSNAITKAEMMGTETTTTMSNKSTGKIILDKATGIIKEKTVTTESTGNTESSNFGTLPLTSKTTTTITVTPSLQKE